MIEGLSSTMVTLLYTRSDNLVGMRLYTRE